jgi:ankyrin repeat protein
MRSNYDPKGGHIDIVERPLAAKAEINVKPARERRRQAAAEIGYTDVVERLLAAGAEVNVDPATKGGRTALQAAANAGHIDIVETP